jgi:hypothetical protein
VRSRRFQISTATGTSPEYIRKQEQQDARLDQLGLWR